MRTSEDISFEEHLSLEPAAEAVADIMLRFDAYVANEQGACDTGTMNTMLRKAARLYDEALV